MYEPVDVEHWPASWREAYAAGYRSAEDAAVPDLPPLATSAWWRGRRERFYQDLITAYYSTPRDCRAGRL